MGRKVHNIIIIIIIIIITIIIVIIIIIITIIVIIMRIILKVVFYRLRSFSIVGRKVHNRGDQVKARTVHSPHDRYQSKKYTKI